MFAFRDVLVTQRPRLLSWVVRRRRQAMKKRRLVIATVGGIAVAVVICLIWRPWEKTTPTVPDRPFKFVSSGGAVATTDERSGNSYEFYAGGAYIAEGDPGVLMGKITSPWDEYIYLVLIKHAAGRGSKAKLLKHDFKHFGGKIATLSVSPGIDIDGRQFQFSIDMAFEFDSDQPKTIRDDWVVGGEKTGPQKGRLLLVDMTKDPVVWKQVLAEIPKGVGHPNSDLEAEFTAKRLLGEMRKNPTVREFFTQ